MLTVLLLLYVAVDFVDPELPGVFCFENNEYFLDAVVEAKDASSDVVTADAALQERWHSADAEGVDDRRRAPVQVSPAARSRWKDLEHRDSALSVASPDSSSVGPA